jgi:hypothetical protein
VTYTHTDQARATLQLLPVQTVVVPTTRAEHGASVDARYLHALRLAVLVQHRKGMTVRLRVHPVKLTVHQPKRVRKLVDELHRQLDDDDDVMTTRQRRSELDALEHLSRGDPVHRVGQLGCDVERVRQVVSHQALLEDEHDLVGEYPEAGVPPGTLSLPLPITVAPSVAISGWAAFWPFVNGAVAEDLHSTQRT